MSEKYYRFLKENGGNRIVTFASNKWEEDICFEFCDVIAVNRYIGWYADNKTWEEFLDSMRRFKNEAGFKDKPIIIGEFGASAIYGDHTFDNVPWTEEYQAELIENCIKLFDADPDVAGAFIWQFSDIRTLPFVTDRARGFNNKGLVNEYRKPKAAYYAARKCYKGE
jgi:beta-glucuronidase